MSLRLLCVLLAACAAPDAPDVPAQQAPEASIVFERAVPTLRTGDHDTYGPVSNATSVWTPTRTWASISDEAGLAWPANSGLTWDEKYRAWVDSLEPVASEGTYDTAEIVTPWGHVLPLNRMECAESAILLRTTFAAWHGLPFFMTAYSPTLGQNVHYGHFGMRTETGAAVPWAPNFTQWQDFTTTWDGVVWPDDTNLEGLALTALQDDVNGFLGPDAYSGAYLDELHLNKRVGYFLLRVLTDFGSIHMAHSENLFDLAPEAIDAGDLLIHRWQATGIGHTMVVKHVERTWSSTEVSILAGSMPRIQPRWTSPAVSRGYFSHDYAGSAVHHPVTDVPYVELGGGLKRWRTPVYEAGRWVNIVPDLDRPDFVDPHDQAALAARTATFATLLGAPTPEGERDALLAAIEAAREALAIRPASCANRERRERAFDALYTLMETSFGMSRQQVDSTYRTLDDYVYAELEYSASSTCCWNSSTPAMAGAILDHAETELADAEAAGTCIEPTIFAKVDGDYAPFAAHAAALGVPWTPWSADEACPQAGSTDDVVAQEPFTPWCDLLDLTDPVDPVDPVGPVDPGVGGEQGGGGCGCNGAQLNGMFTLLMAGLVLRRSRRD